MYHWSIYVSILLERICIKNQYVSMEHRCSTPTENIYYVYVSQTTYTYHFSLLEKIEIFVFDLCLIFDTYVLHENAPTTTIRQVQVSKTRKVYNMKMYIIERELANISGYRMETVVEGLSAILVNEVTGKAVLDIQVYDTFATLFINNSDKVFANIYDSTPLVDIAQIRNFIQVAFTRI